MVAYGLQCAITYPQLLVVNIIIVYSDIETLPTVWFYIFSHSYWENGCYNYMHYKLHDTVINFALNVHISFKELKEEKTQPYMFTTSGDLHFFSCKFELSPAVFFPQPKEVPLEFLEYSQRVMNFPRFGLSENVFLFWLYFLKVSFPGYSILHWYFSSFYLSDLKVLFNYLLASGVSGVKLAVKL